MKGMQSKKPGNVVIKEVPKLRQCSMECSVLGCDGFTFEPLSEGGRCHVSFIECSGNVIEEHFAGMKYFELI